MNRFGFFKRGKGRHRQNNDHIVPSTSLINISQSELSRDVIENEKTFRKIFENTFDVIFRAIPSNYTPQVLLIYIDGLVDTKLLDEVLLKPIMFQGIPRGIEQPEDIGQTIRDQLVPLAQTKTVTKISEAVDGILKSKVLILVNEQSDALMADIAGFEKRSIEEPPAESVVRGPREGFTETLIVNTSLLRRKLRHPSLKMENRTIGEEAKTDIVIAYIKGIASETVLEEVRKRLDRIVTDPIVGTNLEEFIEDQTFSPFPQIQNTERPDIVAASLMEGKVAIIEDGNPFVLIVPMTFWTGLQAADDYYERFIYSSLVRILRIILYLMSIYLPSLYVSLTSYHPQLIPTNLLLAFAAAREGVPFPAVFEALIMEFIFEGLREAGIRLPKTIGSAVSIVGALVIGQAAVQAGIVSAPMVIVVSTTGIASFTIPRYNMGTATRMIRFPMLILAGMYGLYGVALGTMILMIHLVNLRSFGVPYLSPVAPRTFRNLKDVFIRAPRRRA
ncbi:spore germination protein [Paenibacillus filicis]|uniref:Spore germination protein n=1 Tax=Paenibacillus gyeongsangnamensis TaxID=3388067 RepID=A0ABT4Q5T1_9BACL|nr:spore germination protein [Paenibacillus filicis]MCZ8512174.1 spore germination protein [Paenibacillus filicis]